MQKKPQITNPNQKTKQTPKQNTNFMLFCYLQQKDLKGKKIGKYSGEFMVQSNASFTA